MKTIFINANRDIVAAFVTRHVDDTVIDSSVTEHKNGVTVILKKEDKKKWEALK